MRETFAIAASRAGERSWVPCSYDLVFPALKYADSPRIAWTRAFGNMSRLHSCQIGDRTVSLHGVEDVRRD